MDLQRVCVIPVGVPLGVATFLAALKLFTISVLTNNICSDIMTLEDIRKENNYGTVKKRRNRENHCL